MNKPRWHLLPDADSVADEAARRVLRAARVAILARGVFRLVLAGGRTPEGCYHRLAAARADWADWEIYFGDERCLPAAHPDRNSRMAARAWLERVPIPPHRIHVIPAELGPHDGARRYAPEVAAALPFDLVLLGLGGDGHTASLFPGRSYPPEDLVHAVDDAPKPPPERVTLSSTALSCAQQVLFLVTGSDKRAALAAWRRGVALPAAAIHPAAAPEILLDAAADPSGQGG
jgi:6-phosphogluconolactonase